jgi:hypothetical protein
LFTAATKLFREVEVRVSGGQKPLYRAFGDLADGYDLWERFHYRQAWEKLKTAVKAFEMAALWGGPPGLTSLLPAIKINAGFLETLVLDPAPVKDRQASDLLAHAGRRLHGAHDPETAMVSLVRALEAFAQRQLFKQYQIKTWDGQPEQLPPALRETCRSCWLEDLDGKYKLPLQYISGSVDEELLLRNEYLVAENRILRDQIKGRLQFNDAERQILAEIGRKLGK